MPTDLSIDLSAFHSFVQEKLGSDEAGELSPEDVLAEWRELHPTPGELTDSVAAVRHALADMQAGDRGRPAEDVVADLRRRLTSGAPT